MKEEESLHQLNENLPNNVDLETLIVLGLNVAVDVHTEHFGDDALDKE